METERIALSQRERDRLRVLHEIKRKQITQIKAARRLKISDRHIRRLLVGLRKLGDQQCSMAYADGHPTADYPRAWS